MAEEDGGGDGAGAPRPAAAANEIPLHPTAEDFGRVLADELRQAADPAARERLKAKLRANLRHQTTSVGVSALTELLAELVAFHPNPEVLFHATRTMISDHVTQCHVRDTCHGNA